MLPQNGRNLYGSGMKVLPFVNARVGWPTSLQYGFEYDVNFRWCPPAPVYLASDRPIGYLITASFDHTNCTLPANISVVGGSRRWTQTRCSVRTLQRSDRSTIGGLVHVIAHLSINVQPAFDGLAWVGERNSRSRRERFCVWPFAARGCLLLRPFSWPRQGGALCPDAKHQ